MLNIHFNSVQNISKFPLFFFYNDGSFVCVLLKFHILKNFLEIFLLLFSNFVPFFKIYWDLFYGPKYILFWSCIAFFKSVKSSLLLMWSKYFLHILIFLSPCSISYWKRYIEIHNYYCKFVYLSVNFCLMFWKRVIRYLCI